MSTVYVFGHKNPDNDAIMSSIMLSQLLNSLNDGNTYIPRRLGAMPAETSAILAKWGIEEPELLEAIEAPAEGEDPQKVMLTDHNEEAQSVDGLYNADIVGCVDHHRIGDFHTTNPVFYIGLPWGSTCSIVYYLFKSYGVEPNEAQLTCLLSAMMTDMVMMKSPTTTDVDRSLVAEIADALSVDPLKFGMDIFMSRPAKTTDEMVAADIKEFAAGGKRILIGQYETVNKATALDVLDALRASMEAYRTKAGADALVLCVTDIMEEGSQVLMCGDTEIPSRALGIEDAKAGVWMPGVMSRKKQVAAPILAAGE